MTIWRIFSEWPIRSFSTGRRRKSGEGRREPGKKAKNSSHGPEGGKAGRKTPGRRGYQF
jgi:hypothetical protein